MVDLINCTFSGSIPSELGMLNIWHLGLGTNRISGTIPTELGLMTTLNKLVLTNNALHGKLQLDVGSVLEPTCS